MQKEEQNASGAVPTTPRPQVRGRSKQDKVMKVLTVPELEQNSKLSEEAS